MQQVPKITQFEQREKQNGLKCMKIKEIWDRERNIVANIIKNTTNISFLTLFLMTGYFSVLKGAELS